MQKLRIIKVLLFFACGGQVLAHEAKKLITNTRHEPISCLSCAFYNKEIETLGGLIASSTYFEARQDCHVQIPGFIIVYSKRHVRSIDEFNQAERNDFIEFLSTMRHRMRQKFNIQRVYLIQEEDSSHFHMWLFPRYEWMNRFGNRIKSVPAIMQWAQENLETSANFKMVQEAAEKLRD